MKTKDNPKELRILLVEDSEHDRAAFRRSARSEQTRFEVTEFERAEDAMAMLSSGDTPFDIIVTDYSLLGMNGLELFTEIRKQGVDIPLVILTGSGNESLAIKALKEGVDDYVIKDPDQGYLEILPVVLPEVVKRHENFVASKQAEEVRRQFVKALAVKNREMERLLLIVSHDLRSPLINIQGFGDTLFDDCTKLTESMKAAQQKSNLEAISTSELIESMTSSIDFIQTSIKKMDVLLGGLSKLATAGQIEQHIERLYMNEMFDEIVKSFQYQVQDSGISIQIDPLVDCNGDKAQINQVFSNLLSNAIRFLDPERDGHIHVYSSIEGPRSIYCVEDNGIGISDEHKSQVFEVFYRVNPKDKIEGEGLGLTTVKLILDRHDGGIRLESEPGVGSRFIVSLPRS
jgi:signal transduction histidine kinase